MIPWEQVDGFWATKSEGVVLIVCAISFQDFQPMTYVVPIHQRYRRTDGQTEGQTDDMQSQDRALHSRPNRAFNLADNNNCYLFS